ncbi:DUF3037 domain-containing protein [Sphingomonas sp. LT1P40]|uniref:DUF3037 domain-containing protein n=1 Tax=Alteristakelama amylovorans TaxID=3096166 RepID=UPI002FCB3B65
MLKRRYTYTVLRYVHDPLTAEFVNVGLVVHFSESPLGPAILKTGTRNTIGRMRDMFPDLDRIAFGATMRSIKRVLIKLADQLGKDGMFASPGDALTFARQVLPSDDSSLQWSPIGGGIAEDPDKTFQRLYQRFVTKYDSRNAPRRSDEEIWKPVRQRLEERHLPIALEPKTIVGGDDKIDFQHAWKKGAWHMYEPVSLDLADAEGIYRKAHRWLGQLASVAPDATEPFHPYFIVGAPSDPELEPAYRRALKILRKSPGQVEVFEETEIEQLVDRIEDAVRTHGAAS